MSETPELIEQFFRWKARSGKPLDDNTRRRYRSNLLRLAAAKGSLLELQEGDLLDYLDTKRHQAPGTRAVLGAAFREFFRFAHGTGLRADNPALRLVAVKSPKRGRSMRRWASAPRRDLLPEEYWPIFDFLRETWGRNPELTSADLMSINAPGRVPEVVEVRKGKRRGQPIGLSPRARAALEQMGGRVPLGWRAIQRAFKQAYRDAFSPTDLKHMPPVGFGVELHDSLEGEVRDLLAAGRMEDAARRAFVEVEDRLRHMTGRDDLTARPLVEHLFGEPDPSATAAQARTRDALRLFLSGAMSLFRNPISHRRRAFPDEAYSFEVVLVADLAMRLLDPIEAQLRNP